MSRIGKKPVVIPAGVTAKLDGQTIAVKGAKGELKFTAPDEVSVVIDGGAVACPAARRRQARARHVGHDPGADANLIGGVTQGFEKKLEINGVGYKAAVAGKNLQLSLGYSHDVHVSDPGRSSRSRRRSRPRSRSPASTSVRSARSRPKSGPFAAPSPIRARASNTPANSSSARKARRSKELAAMAKLKVNGRAAQGARPPRDRAPTPTASRGSACSVPRSRSMRRSSTTSKAAPSRPPRRSRRRCARRSRPARRRGRAHRRQGDRRASEEGGRRQGRVRPRRLHVSRARQGAGRGRARGRPRLLSGQARRRGRAIAIVRTEKSNGA